MSRRATVLALTGALLVAVTASGWMWSTAHLLDDDIRTGFLPCCAALIAWASGARTAARIPLRVVHGLLAWAAVGAIVGLLLVVCQPAGTGYIVSYEAGLELVVVPLVLAALVVGWHTRRAASPARRRALAALVSVPIAVVGAVSLVRGAELRGVLELLAAGWLFAVLLTPPATRRPTRRWVAALTGVIAALTAAAVAGALFWPSETRPVYEYGDPSGGITFTMGRYDGQTNAASLVVR